MKMKVLYIIHSCIMGGATISFINLVDGVLRNGVVPVVVHPRPEEKDARLIRELSAKGCECVELPVVSSVLPLRDPFAKKIIRPLWLLGKKRTFYKDLLRLVKEERPDIVHTNTGVVHEGYLVARKLGIPHVWHLREYQTTDFCWRPFPSLRKFVKCLKDSYTVCITKDIQRYFGLENFEKSFSIYNPTISLSCIPESGARENYFLVANRVSREKGMEDIIDAFSDFARKKTSFELRIAGFGSEGYVRELKERCEALGISGRVAFLGYTDKVPELMEKAKALVVGSFSEGFGRMTAEANMSFLPVIGRNTAGTKEILSQTGGGILFDSVKEMAGAMERMADMSESEIAGFMAGPQKVAVSLFSTEEHVKKMLDLYRKISGGGTNV